MGHENRRNLIFISLSQFGMTVSSNFVLSIMPFFILKVSPYPPQETLLWIGSIMGVSHLVTAAASNFWGFLTTRFSPKLLYMRGLLAHTLAFLLMGFTSNLHFLFVLRLIQGILGGVSTIGLVIVSESSSKEKISGDIGLFQTFLTLGLLTGPLFGSVVASFLGYNGAFLFASALLALVLFFCHMNVTEVPRRREEERNRGARTITRRSILAWFLCFSSTIQLMFLPSILPTVLEKFEIEKTAALNWAGIIIALYTATATVGTYFWTRIARRVGRDRLLLFLVVSGTCSLAALSLDRGIMSFIVIRMIHTGLITACVPLVISMFAADLQGGVIGFLNSGRFAGNACGHIFATALLAFSNLRTTYLTISAMTLVAFLGFRLVPRDRRTPPPPGALPPHGVSE